jgi:hypothetical protein
MKNRAKIMWVLVAAVPSFIGLLFIIGTAFDIKSTSQLQQLLSFRYLSFVDSLEAGGISGMTNDFFTGVGLLLLGSTLFTKVKRVSWLARCVAGVIFTFVAICLVFACLTPQIGVKPF